MPEVALGNQVKNNIESPKLNKGHSGNTIGLTRIQKLIYKRMLESKANKPCFYLESKADVTEMMKLRPKLRKTFGVKITTNAFFIRSLALAARKYPLMTGKLDGDNIRIADSINVGFAVNAPQGLVVPVIKEADKKSLVEIAKLEKALTEKGRDNKLTLVDMEGETIALSNLGAYDIDSFFGIVPPLASTIMAVGNIIPVVVPQGGEVGVRKMVSLTLAADNRVINEYYAAKFLSCITEQLSNPDKLIKENGDNK